jgi:hypothetical protein
MTLKEFVEKTINDHVISEVHKQFFRVFAKDLVKRTCEEFYEDKPELPLNVLPSIKESRAFWGGVAAHSLYTNKKAQQIIKELE